MDSDPNPLHKAFLEDHKVLIRGLARIRAALIDGDVAAAARTADEIDRAVGAHMRFEEKVFYPKLRSKLGDEFVDQLYSEHGMGQAAVRLLIELEAGGGSGEGAKVWSGARSGCSLTRFAASRSALSICATVAAGW